MTKTLAGFSLLLLCGLAMCVSCTNSAATGPSTAGKSVMLNTEPAESTDVIDMKSGIRMGAIPMDGTAVLSGKVLSGQDWETDQATFVVRDLAREAEEKDHGHAEGEDHSECAFCQANKKKDTESLALVQVVDESGAVIGSDARKLLGLEENNVVVAEGSGELMEDGTLVFSAKKLFIRK